MANPSASWCARRHFDAKQHNNTQSSCKQQAEVCKITGTRLRALDLSETCSQILIRHLKNKDDESARKHLNACCKEIKKVSRKAFVHSVIHCCAKAGCVSTAMWCGLQLSNFGLSPNVVTFNTLLDACAKQGHIDMANQIWELMTHTGVKPNTITYGTMINACSQAHDAWLAEKWLMTMLDEGLVPCVASYTTVIASFLKMCKPEKAEAWFAQMLEAEVKPDRCLYNTMVDAFARTGQPAKAEQLLLEMQGRGFVLGYKDFCTIIHACAKISDWNRLMFWLHMMDHQGFVLHENILDSVTEQGGVLCVLGPWAGSPGLPADNFNLPLPVAPLEELPPPPECPPLPERLLGSASALASNPEYQ